MIRENLIFFQKRHIFKFVQNVQFFPHTKIAKQKNRNEQNFSKYIISQISNTKEIHENIVKKIFAEIFL